MRLDLPSPDDLSSGDDLPQGAVELAAAALVALDLAAGSVPEDGRVADGLRSDGPSGDDPAGEMAAEDPRIGSEAALGAVSEATSGADPTATAPHLRAVSAPGPGPVDRRARALLGLRARLLGLRPRGRHSAGGACRLVAASDGWAAVHLPRASDVELLPAWLGVAVSDAEEVPWSALEAAVSRRPVDQLVTGGQELGLAVARVPTPDDLEDGDEQLHARETLARQRPFVVSALGRPGPARPFGAPMVVDLSSLWAGPSCARLLADRGARVLKVESTERPDGARHGPPEFFEAVNAGKGHLALPLHIAAGRQELRRLLATADVVVEGSRPRALEQMGIEPTEVAVENPALVWVAITGYGRSGPWRNRVGYGDDTAAAGGLVRWGARDRPSFVGDALADPLAGVVAAALAARAVRSGGGVLVDIALREVARAAALGSSPAFDVQWRRPR